MEEVSKRIDNLKESVKQVKHISTKVCDQTYENFSAQCFAANDKEITQLLLKSKKFQSKESLLVLVSKLRQCLNKEVQQRKQLTTLTEKYWQLKENACRERDLVKQQLQQFQKVHSFITSQSLEKYRQAEVKDCVKKVKRFELQVQELVYEFNTLQKRVQLMKTDAKSETSALQSEVQSLRTQLFKKEMLSRTVSKTRRLSEPYCPSLDIPPISKSQDRKTFDSPPSYYKPKDKDIPPQYRHSFQKSPSEISEEKQKETQFKAANRISSFQKRELTFLKESFWSNSNEDRIKPNPTPSIDITLPEKFDSSIEAPSLNQFLDPQANFVKPFRNLKQSDMDYSVSTEDISFPLK